MEWKGLELNAWEMEGNGMEWKGLNAMNGKGWEMEGYVMEGLSTLIVP